MPYDPNIHHRRSIRLKDYDYASAGAYFVTICVEGRLCLFGEIVAGEMMLNEAGRMIESTWQKLPERFPAVALDQFVIMPNHFHGIVILQPLDTQDVGAPLVGAQRAGTSPAPTPPRDEMGNVGAPLVGAQRAGTSPAPTPPCDEMEDVGAPLGGAPRAGTSPAPTLGTVIGAFKSLTTREYMKGMQHCQWTPFPWRLWQRNYYEHIVRNDEEMTHIRSYIMHNAARWADDAEHPDRWTRP